jgi:pimeloyl-ACP methyl ester carboxylesterase
MLAPYARLLAGAVPMETVAPDLPGYGLTGTGGRPVDYRDWVDCFADLVVAEGARDGRPVYVLGASMGGMLTYSAAARGGARGDVPARPAQRCGPGADLSPPGAGPPSRTDAGPDAVAGRPSEGRASRAGLVSP